MLTFPQNIHISDNTASACVYGLNERPDSITTCAVVKHEQKKKDKSSKLSKELESETRNLVNLI